MPPGAPFFTFLAWNAAERPSGRQHAPKIDPNRPKIHPKSIQNLLKCYHRTLENNRRTLPKFMHKIQATTLGNPTRRAFLLRVRRSRVASSIYTAKVCMKLEICEEYMSKNICKNIFSRLARPQGAADSNATRIPPSQHWWLGCLEVWIIDDFGMPEVPQNMKRLRK